jgi:hypothetical protein
VASGRLARKPGRPSYARSRRPTDFAFPHDRSFFLTAAAPLPSLLLVFLYPLEDDNKVDPLFEF